MDGRREGNKERRTEEGRRNHRERSSKEIGRGGRKERRIMVVRELN